MDVAAPGKQPPSRTVASICMYVYPAQLPTANQPSFHYPRSDAALNKGTPQGSQQHASTMCVHAVEARRVRIPWTEPAQFSLAGWDSEKAVGAEETLVAIATRRVPIATCAHWGNSVVIRGRAGYLGFVSLAREE